MHPLDVLGLWFGCIGLYAVGSLIYFSAKHAIRIRRIVLAML